MEFSYRINEDEYVRACKIACKPKKGFVAKAVVFWVFVVVCLILLSLVVQKAVDHPQSADSEQTESISAPASHSASTIDIVKNLAPMLAILTLWICLFVWQRGRLKRLYWKDTNSHGEMTVTLDTQSVSVRSSIGISFESGWNAFSDWNEKQNIVLLRFPVGTFYILNIKDLSETERGELRGILSSALPKK